MKAIRTGAKLARKSLSSGAQPLLFAQVRYGTIQQIPSAEARDAREGSREAAVHAYRWPAGGMSSFLNRGSISSLIASLYTVAAITVAAAFASSSTTRS